MTAERDTPHAPTAEELDAIFFGLEPDVGAIILDGIVEPLGISDPRRTDPLFGVAADNAHQVGQEWAGQPGPN